MKKSFLLFILFLIVQQNILAQCKSGSYTITTNAVINGSCIITGDLTIVNGATLNVNLTSAGADTFVVRGNILLKGNAVLWVHAAPGAIGDQFIVSNSFNNQRTITTQDSSRIQLENIEFRTQEGNLAGASSIYMNYNASGKSILYVNKSSLDVQKAWVLFNLYNKATLIGYEPNHLPTEIYLQDTAQVVLHGPGTNVGLWLNFESITTTLNLPPDQTQPFTWKVGRGAGGLNTQWYLEMDTVQSGVGIQVFPSAKLTVNGAGFPPTGELKVALIFANGTDTIKNLKAGLQNTTVANGMNGSVKLNNVNLGPIAWQLYALMNENLFVKRSVVNEIGIAGPSSVVVDSSLLQLAVLASVGVGGSTMSIKNSEIWNQEITAANNSTITLDNCKVYGSAFNTGPAPSHITVNGGCFFQNPAGCTANTMVNIATGQPYCNPFIPAGFPQILTPATITLNSVNNNCTTGVGSINDDGQITIYPNPFSNETIIQTAHSFKDATLTIYNTFGQSVKQITNVSGQTVKLLRENLSNGLYFIRFTEENKVIATNKLVITD
jgi:hypothetical protein